MNKALPALVNHREVAKAFGVSIPVILRAVRKGEFATPVTTVGTFYLFDRSTIEHKLRTGTWPARTKFRGMPIDGEEGAADEGPTRTDL